MVKNSNESEMTKKNKKGKKNQSKNWNDGRYSWMPIMRFALSNRECNLQCQNMQWICAARTPRNKYTRGNISIKFHICIGLVVVSVLPNVLCCSLTRALSHMFFFRFKFASGATQRNGKIITTNYFENERENFDEIEIQACKNRTLPAK